MMKTMSDTLCKRTYAAPDVQLCTVSVERGFEASMPGITINPWESESDSLEF